MTLKLATVLSVSNVKVIAHYWTYFSLKAQVALAVY